MRKTVAVFGGCALLFCFASAHAEPPAPLVDVTVHAGGDKPRPANKSAIPSFRPPVRAVASAAPTQPTPPSGYPSAPPPIPVPVGSKPIFSISPGAAPVATAGQPSFALQGILFATNGMTPYALMKPSKAMVENAVWMSIVPEQPGHTYGVVFAVGSLAQLRVTVIAYHKTSSALTSTVLAEESVKPTNGRVVAMYSPIQPAPTEIMFVLQSDNEYQFYGLSGFVR